MNEKELVFLVQWNKEGMSISNPGTEHLYQVSHVEERVIKSVVPAFSMQSFSQTTM